jgi:creatinine amidohydrolase
VSVLRLEELSTPALEALDRARTVVLLSVSPLEQHGPHLPVGVDLMTARHLAESLAERLVARRPDWTAVLAPSLPLGSFTFEAAGTIRVRQRAVRDVVADYGHALARAGFRYVLIANGHGGPGHLVALDEAAGAVSRRHGIVMASLTGPVAWELLRGRLAPRVEAALGRPLSAEEREALAEDAHAGWWETAVMLLLRPDLVDPAYRELPPARYPLVRRLQPNYPLRAGGQGYVGHPARADLALAKATLTVLVDEIVALAEALLDGTRAPAAGRSPFYRLPPLRTGFWPGLGLAAGAAGALWTVARLAGRRPPRRTRGPGPTPDREEPPRR